MILIDFPPDGLSVELDDLMDDITRAYICEALRRSRSVPQAASLLHMDTRALRYRIKKLGIKRQEVMDGGRVLSEDGPA